MSLRLCEQNNNAQRTGFNKQSFQNGSYKFRLRYLGAKYRILRSNSNTVRVLNYTGPFKQSEMIKFPPFLTGPSEKAFF